MRFPPVQVWAKEGRRCPAEERALSLPSIQLLDEERDLFSVLLEALAASGTQAELRVAGGWVRDRLLGRACKDLDIVVDRVSGYDLAMIVAQHLERTRGLGRDDLGFRRNPKQSRHLATGFLRLGGLSIEFMQLRRERYRDDSRIPAIETDGVSLLEDAQRRDFTVNAMYFHLGDRIVEDPLCQGWFDLQARVLRTTHDALTSFREDPLRILRAIRFAARLDFALALPWKEIARDDESVWQGVLDAFERKVAGERVWRELIGYEDAGEWTAGCLMGRAPLRVIELLELFGLRQLLFAPREGDDLPAECTSRRAWLAHVDPRPRAILAQRVLRCLQADPMTLAVVRMATVFAGFPAVCAARLARCILDRTKAPTPFARRVVALVEALHTGELEEAWEGGAIPPNVVRRLGADVDRWLDLAEAVEAARLGVFARSYAPLRDALHVQREHEAVRGPFPITGKDLLERGVSPGPRVGALLRQLERCWFDEPDVDRDVLLGRLDEFGNP
ncbi:MAG: CCA tRNA nucleotidyltransferase [Planctomycetes bacterium]|nr:CCA tRNA nucleotidyltransferase [Planctomycetota bacterium]MCB9892241.1 CCA tRNA nucleotidyltransferase [Planctomycetota bacterium]